MYGIEPRELKWPHCQVCGSLPDTLYTNATGEIVGCDRCLKIQIPRCPECGSISDRMYEDEFGEIIGCDKCLVPVDVERCQ